MGRVRSWIEDRIDTRRTCKACRKLEVALTIGHCSYLQPLSSCRSRVHHQRADSLCWWLPCCSSSHEPQEASSSDVQQQQPPQPPSQRQREAVALCYRGRLRCRHFACDDMPRAPSIRCASVRHAIDRPARVSHRRCNCVTNVLLTCGGNSAEHWHHRACRRGQDHHVRAHDLVLGLGARRWRYQALALTFELVYKLVCVHGALITRTVFWR